MSKLIANETQAFQVLDTFADSRVTLIKGMKEAGYTTLEECDPIVIKWACAKVGAKWQIKASVLQYVFFGMIRIITQIIPASSASENRIARVRSCVQTYPVRP